MSTHKKLYLSVVSSEFGTYREPLTKDLSQVADVMQPDFTDVSLGGGTLGRRDKHIRACDGVIHLIGKATGDAPGPIDVAALLRKYPDFDTKLPTLAPDLRNSHPGLSYAQWEAYLAMYHERRLFFYRPTDFLALISLGVPRDPHFVLNPAEVNAQLKHYQRILELRPYEFAHYHDGGYFRDREHLSSAVLRDLAELVPMRETKTASATSLHDRLSEGGDKSDAVPPLPDPQTVGSEGTRPILFLCYRREDTSDAAGRLHDRLVSDYGPDGVFIDIDSVPLGIDFVDHVAQQISKCSAVIVMIGKQWTKVKDKRRRRRLDNEDDLVRAEISAALQQKVPVIPVLVQDATMPSADELPENIRLLARRNGISLSASRWRTDVERLIKELDPVMKR